MQGQPQVKYPGKSPAGGGECWAGSPVLYLLTCYDVWSATPRRGCEPPIADTAEEICPVA
jgi:hypothetical protein